jgi:hypothetical protein
MQRDYSTNNCECNWPTRLEEAINTWQNTAWDLRNYKSDRNGGSLSKHLQECGQDCAFDSSMVVHWTWFQPSWVIEPSPYRHNKQATQAIRGRSIGTHGDFKISIPWSALWDDGLSLVVTSVWGWVCWLDYTATKRHFGDVWEHEWNLWGTRNWERRSRVPKKSKFCCSYGEHVLSSCFRSAMIGNSFAFKQVIMTSSAGNRI